MEPRMMAKPALTIVGVTAVGQPGELNYSEIWEKRYMPLDEQLKPYSIDQGYYGATLSENGQLVYLAGMAVEGMPEIPAGAEMRLLPAGYYAVFDCALNAIGATWREAYEGWLPGSTFALDSDKADFEYYPPYPGEGDMKVEIYIPVKPKEAIQA